MDILIVDSDPSIKEFYVRLMESEFRNVNITFCSDFSSAMSSAACESFDLVLTDNKGEGDFFKYLEELLYQKQVVIVIASEYSDRFIVESLRMGAVDFISKQSIKLGYLKDLIVRALLEGDRRSKIQEFAATIPHRPEYLDVNQKIRGMLKDEDIERRRALFSEGAIASHEQELKEGETYDVTYLFSHVYLPPEEVNSRGEEKVAEIRRMIMGKLTEIPARYGGSLWTIKDDACIFGFIGETQMGAALAAMEMRAFMNVFNVTIENVNEHFSLNAAISSGRTVYHENKGDIYSEALNLSAHMAYDQPRKKNLRVTREIFDKLWPRARRYFFPAEPFEGREVFKYENIA